ncbi:exodeoxyribonuclease V subunit gamma [Actinospongicola halichondriae]|uniref:exodeoxyribonuclease V subunit gamma n=1 Tax=Actinospongicola halichondriae TaxID=3236844 RepID=UPI003D53EF5F
MFQIHRSARADALVDALVDVVTAPTGDPFTPELIAVPTRGVERWLTHRIAAAAGTGPGREDGVCANVDFPFPGRLVGDVLAEASGVDRREDPWRPERLVWPLLEVIDESMGQEWLALLATHLGYGTGTSAGDDLRQDRRFATARHLADLFDQYGIHRPDLVLSWLDHRGASHHDGVADDAQWQPRLWLALRDRVATPSPPERIAQACARLRAGTIEVDLPDRISLFGLTRLPATYLDVLRAIAVSRDVHLFALHPSSTLWDRVAATSVPPLPLPRADDPTAGLAENPLLRTWGTDTREMQLVLTAAADAVHAHHPIDDGPPTSLLQRVQADVRDDRAPVGRPRPGVDDERHVLDDRDRSIEVHSCHGRARQVEVARDAICHALADDSTLEPRDVIVLCPDIDKFAPLLHATFGAAAPRPDPGAPAPPERGVPYLPYRLADRSLRQTNPLLASLDTLLALVDSRLTAPDLISFIGREPVRTRFQFDDDAIERIAEWTSTSGARWGLDGARRARYQLADVDANTWRAGLDRVLLGVAMSTDGSRLLGGRLPLDDVESGDVDLAGRFAEVLDRIDTVVGSAAEAHPIGEWVELLGRSVDLLMAARPADAWQRVQVDHVLREVLDEATADGESAQGPLSLAEVRALLRDRLRGMPTRADFRTGAITMCTLVPMRAVPHRVVCILGLDDGTFPRTGRADGDDLLRRLPHVGDRDPRTEDRQLLLDALLAATDRLIITTTGADVRTNEPRPPAVPLSELLDVIDRTAVTSDGVDGGAAVTTSHPLQPFDPAAHRVDGDRGPWAFDLVGLAGARAVQAPRSAAPRFLPVTLPPAPTTAVIALDDLVRFVQHPVREFLRQRLGLNVWEDDDALDDAIPVELDALQRWAIGQRLLQRLLAGDEIEAAVEAELAVGALPPQAMGRATIESIEGIASRIHAVAESVDAAGVTSSVEIDVPLGEVDALGSVSLVGTVTGIRGDATSQVSFSSIGARQRLVAWVRLLALSAARPESPWRALTVGKQRNGGGVVEVGPIDGPPDRRREVAIGHLTDLVRLRSQGLREPLPIPCKTAGAWAEARARGREPEKSAARDWESNHRFPGEDADRSHQIVFGGVRRLDELVAMEPTAAERGEGWAEDEPSRLGRLSRRLWDPLLAVERRR